MKSISLLFVILIFALTLSTLALAQDLSATRARPNSGMQQPSVDPRESRVAPDAAASDVEARKGPLSSIVGFDKQGTPSVTDPGIGVYSSWIGRLMRNSSSTERPNTSAFKKTVRAAGNPQSTSLFPNSAKSSNAESELEILSPRAGDRFALRQIQLSIRLNDRSIDYLQILITKKAGKVVYDSGPVVVRGKPKVWRHSIQVGEGEYTIEAIGRDANMQRVGESAQSSFIREAVSPFDERGTFEASAYIGYGIDSFAAADLRKYLNPEASGQIEERLVGGFDFAYRLFGDPMKANGHQLWVYGETVHGVRSADVDCKANPDQPLCKDLLNGETPGDQLIAILRKASSLEGFAGVRWEFAGIRGDDSPARAYLKSQFGFVTVAGLGGDVVDLHDYLALGLTATRGRFRNSYLEAGIGKSDFFFDNKKKRFKIDGFLSWGSDATQGLASMIRPFAQITVDSDFGKGSDSVQCYFGIDFDLSFLWKKKTTN